MMDGTVRSRKVESSHRRRIGIIYTLVGQSLPVFDFTHCYTDTSVGLFCPFAHRVNLIRHIKRLTGIISLSVVRPYPKDGGGWQFPASDEEYPNATVDHLFGSKFLSEVYFKDDKDYKGKYSVPLLWDKKTERIVNNVRTRSYCETGRALISKRRNPPKPSAGSPQPSTPSSTLPSHPSTSIPPPSARKSTK